MSSHSIKICWLHLVWCTKNRFPYFQDEKKARECLRILKEICRDKKIYFQAGYVNAEHVRMLIDLPLAMSIKEGAQNLKGISSHHINSSDMFTAKFSWARGYGAFSVSESKLKIVDEYISKQKEHHQKLSFAQEWETLQKKYENR
ncbi:MAG TPA: IS200/IS605 family transposase [Candidatus Cloacimonas sp.]|jgi:putative transposase|nr:IS200/IS605 family transposase [Candidatus Cloacimonas sp.]